MLLPLCLKLVIHVDVPIVLVVIETSTKQTKSWAGTGAGSCNHVAGTVLAKFWSAPNTSSTGYQSSDRPSLTSET